MDAPSGTARLLFDAMRLAGYSAIDRRLVHARRVHSRHARRRLRRPSETVTLTHTVRDRAVFAHGALEAAKWLNGRRGWFTHAGHD